MWVGLYERSVGGVCQRMWLEKRQEGRRGSVTVKEMDVRKMWIIKMCWLGMSEECRRVLVKW